MRVLLSTIGSRGDVQPLVALGLKLRELEVDVRLCAPPDFRPWIEGLGLDAVPIGPELRKSTTTGAVPTPEQFRRLAEESVAAQFRTVGEAAEGCDVIVAATGIQIAARSIAEARGIPYVFAAYAPNVVPSPHHEPAGGTSTAQFTMFAPVLNAHRAALGLAPVEDVRDHILGDRPWLAADPVLAPWPGPADAVVQTGAWILPDHDPLSAGLEKFLDDGEPPVYFGFGSLRAPGDLGEVAVRAARALGRRAIVSRGWAEVALPDDGPDCLSLGDVNQQTLFPRLAAVVHHGGAGTTTAAAMAGVPQVVIPQHYDQPYFAHRVEDLGIGVAHAPGAPTASSLTTALEKAWDARSIAADMRRDGAAVAAGLVMSTVS